MLHEIQEIINQAEGEQLATLFPSMEMNEQGESVMVWPKRRNPEDIFINMVTAIDEARTLPKKNRTPRRRCRHRK